MQVRLNNPGSRRIFGNSDLHVIADEYHSFSQGIALQQGYGTGVSQEIGALVVQGDIWYLHEKRYNPAPSFSSGAFRIFESYTFFPSKRFTLTEDYEIVLPFETVNALVVRGAVELVTKLGSPATSAPFSLTMTYSDYYFRNAPQPYKQSYSKVSAGIVYVW